jgi:large repetitive protein
MSMIINPYLINLGGCVNVQGLNLQVGTGTTNIFQYPAYGLYNFSWTSMIWDAAEMAGTKQITGIEIEIGGYTVPYTYNNQTIKLAHLDPATTQFDNNPAVNWSDMPVSDVTIVKTFNWTISTSGWLVINFDTPFCYNGTSNLILGWENRDGSWAFGYGYAESTLISRKGAYKNNDPAFPTGNGNRYSYRMNIRFKY